MLFSNFPYDRFFAKRLNRKPIQIPRIKCSFFTREDPEKRSTLETPLEESRKLCLNMLSSSGNERNTGMEALSMLFHCDDSKYYCHIPGSDFMFKRWIGPGMDMN